VDEFGKAHSLDIARAPHILIAGATGSGKSVLLHSIIASLIKKNSPEQVRLLLIDPKRVEFSVLEGIPHLLTPAITDAKKTVIALRWLAREMGRRFDILEDKRVRDINGYHKVRSKKDEPLPFIVVIFDEIADIMSAYPRELETSVIRLAQMSRAVGIHIIISTSRPSVNVVTGMMKANIPTRIAGQAHSQIDSRVILDMTGAEKLDGLGDMLFLGGELTRPIRMQTYSIYDVEIQKNRKEAMKKYPTSLDETFEDTSSILSIDSDDGDEMFEEAKRAVIQAGKASTSFLQRKLGIGYSRSAKLLDLLEERGVIAPGEGAKPREVLHVN
jgi:DNA segregation ATPase FtsK/SpoIIIE, S-DNA-T family